MNEAQSNSVNISIFLKYRQWRIIFFIKCSNPWPSLSFSVLLCVQALVWPNLVSKKVIISSSSSFLSWSGSRFAVRIAGPWLWLRIPRKPSHRSKIRGHLIGWPRTKLSFLVSHQEKHQQFPTFLLTTNSTGRWMNFVSMPVTKVWGLCAIRMRRAWSSLPKWDIKGYASFQNLFILSWCVKPRGNG